MEMGEPQEFISMKKEQTALDVEKGFGGLTRNEDDVAQMTLPEMPILVELRDLCYEVSVPIPGKNIFVPTKMSKKTVFQKVNLQVTPGEFLAIMGPTGCGKTSLLNVISGRATKGLTGDLLFNNTKRTKEMKRFTGYVLQDDLMFGALTVEQTLSFTAALRLPLNAADRKQRVDELITAMNLNKCRHTIIGDQYVRGVSGGERKRTNIANELITNPSLILLDEPTSGLDSFTAEALIGTLQAIARQGRTVVTTIHQPSSQTFAMFDKLLLMAEGRVVYYGPAKEMVSYFSRLGHVCPPAFNPADFALGLLVSEDMKGTVSIKKQLIEAYADHSSKNIGYQESEIGRRSTILDLMKAAEEQRKSGVLTKKQSGNVVPPKLGSTVSVNTGGSTISLSNQQRYRTEGKKRWYDSKYPTTWWMQVFVLLRRALTLQKFKIFDKNPLINAIIPAILAGLIFLDVPHREDRIRDRTAVIFFLAVFAGGFTPLLAGCFTFPSEEPIIRKERRAGSYGLSAYYIAKCLADIPLQILYCTIFVVISYWMAGLNSNPEKFFAYLGIVLLSNFTCYSLGMLVGATFPQNIQFGTLMATILILGMMLIGGFYVPLEHLPWWIRWAQYLSVLRYLYMALLANDLSGEAFKQMDIVTEYDRFGKIISGDDVLKVLKIEPDLVWAWCLVLFGYALLYRLLGYLALRILNKPRG